MRRAIIGASLLVLLGLLSGGPPAWAQKKKPGADLDKDPDKTSVKMMKAGVLVGVVKNIYEDKRKIRLEVTISYTKLDPGQVNALAGAQQRMVQARLNRDLNAMRQAQLDIAQAQARLYTVESTKRDVELEARDDVIVRTARPKDDFDEKGKLKKYTKAELKELKGPDPKMPGYKAEFSDVTTEQLIQVSLVKKKGAAPARPAPRPKKGKDADKDIDPADLDPLGDNLPRISMIVILRDAPPSR